ncbi:MAG: hypothetical protein HY842_20150 [Bacteroidetes bacterium]|nr:hypothetical protein [Bacteroidota bacterium]
MKTFLTIVAFLFAASLAHAQQNKWLTNEQNVLRVSIADIATKSELASLKKTLWDTYQIRLDYPAMEFRKNNGKLSFLSLKVEIPTGEIGMVSCTFVRSSQRIGFHYARNSKTEDTFGVWTM